MSYELIIYSTYSFYIVFVPKEKMCSIPAYARVSVPENDTSRVVQGDASAVTGEQFISERKKIVDHLIGFNVWFCSFT